MKARSNRPLLVALAANAAFSTVSASVLLAFPDVLVDHLAVLAGELREVGAMLALFVGQLALTAWGVTRDPPRVLPVLVVIAADALWVVGTLALLPLAYGDFTSLGAVLFAAVGAVVGLLAFAQWRAINRLFAEPGPDAATAQRLEVTRDVDVSARRLWPIVADLGSIAEHADGLASVRLDDAPGVGATRTCTSRDGKRWSEHVTGWEEGRSLTLRFLSERADFPFPMAPMVGGWTLEPRGEHACRVTVWWSFTVRPRWLSPLIVPLMARRVRADMGATIASMEALSRTLPMPDTEAA